MKFVRYGDKGYEKPGCIDASFNIRDLSHIVSDFADDVLSPENLASLKTIALETLPLIDKQTRLGPCVNKVGKFICVGLNYADHATETGAEIPEEPVIFLKATSAINGPTDVIMIPRGSTHTDWEVELGVIIGKKAKHVSEEDATNYIAGYCIIDDVTERYYQKHNTTQWSKGKSCDTFGPIGPWLVTTDEIPNPQELDLWLEVDGKRYQHSHTSNMLFSVKYLVSYLSQFFTLYPGDIISTGTPPGIGMAQKPNPIYLKANQVVRLGIAGLGEQKHLMQDEII